MNESRKCWTSKPASAICRGRARRREFKGKIEFDHVNFSYDEKTPVLKDVKFLDRAGPGGGNRRTIREPAKPQSSV